MPPHGIVDAIALSIPDFPTPRRSSHDRRSVKTKKFLSRNARAPPPHCYGNPAGRVREVLASDHGACNSFRDQISGRFAAR
jgi:hypothetical protein